MIFFFEFFLVVLGRLGIVLLYIVFGLGGSSLLIKCEKFLIVGFYFFI